MSKSRTIAAVVVLGILVGGISTLLAARVFAHCDSTNGPLIPEAKSALVKGDVGPILKWVKKDNEAEIRTAFARAVAVRARGPEAMGLADQYFLETLVRLHRAGEGAPYTGIKDEPVDPIMAMADKALVDGSADEMIKKISGHMEEAIRERFRKVVEARKDKNKSVEAGRAFVDAYVTYVHYVEGIHNTIMRAGAQHAEAGEGSAGHRD